MAIKTLLVAGMATFGLCTGAFAPDNSSDQHRWSSRSIRKLSDPAANSSQRWCSANVAVPSQSATLVNTVAQISVQTNAATSVSAPVKVNAR